MKSKKKIMLKWFIISTIALMLLLLIKIVFGINVSIILIIVYAIWYFKSELLKTKPEPITGNPMTIGVVLSLLFLGIMMLIFQDFLRTIY